MSDHIAGKVIVITGAASGFGRLVAQKVAAREAQVVCADIDEAGLDATVSAVQDRKSVV